MIKPMYCTPGQRKKHVSSAVMQKKELKTKEYVIYFTNPKN